MELSTSERKHFFSIILYHFIERIASVFIKIQNAATKNRAAFLAAL
jgi:hypothetical protein